MPYLSLKRLHVFPAVVANAARGIGPARDGGNAESCPFTFRHYLDRDQGRVAGVGPAIHERVERRRAALIARGPA